MRDALVELALKAFPPPAPIAELGGRASPPPQLASRAIMTVRDEDVLAFLDESARDPLAAVLAPWPTRYAPLMPFLQALRPALRDDGTAILCDLVWQTAPTPDLLRAFAPAPGRDKVRPIEGYEMQIEHAGFEIQERVDVDRAAWTRELGADQRAAVTADTRGAARVIAWVLSPANDNEDDEPTDE